MTNQAVLSHLITLSAQLVLPTEEKDKIETSVKAIKDKLLAYFADDGLKEVKPFGSFDRNTLLSRKADSESDVDILIVFDEKKWEAQTYLTKLKKFAEDNYSRSDNYQDHPTIVIELNHIKFELTPCIFKDETLFVGAKYLIPKKENSELEWIKTEPNLIKNKIDEFKETKNTLVDLIIIFKYWNFANKSPYKTFKVENFVIDKFDYEEGLDYNFFRIIDRLNYLKDTEAQNDLNRKTKKHKENMELLLENNMEEYALMEIQKILPSLT